VKKLHQTQIKLLELLRSTIDDPLTIRDLGKAVGLDSPGVVYHHLTQLERKGYLKRNPNNSKDYVLLDTPERPIVYINKYGMAQCGPEGLILDGNVIDRIPMPSSLLKFPASEAFIVEARGNSMEPKIYAGDIVIAKRQLNAEHSDIAVCVYEEKAIIKKILKFENHIVLYSLNQEHEPITVTDPYSLRIEGIVKQVLHNGLL
jgi:repressor LexA